MKKIFFIAGLFMLASCETLLLPDPTGPERQIALQARLMTTDTLHTVYAAYSEHDSLEQAEDLTIACYVNGECVAVTSESVVGETEKYSDKKAQWRAYTFRADIHPGDSVRIEATSPTERATASVKAPDAVPVPEVSMDVIPSEDGESYLDRLRFRIHVEDQPGKRNWYRLSTSMRRVVNERHPAGVVYPYYGWTGDDSWHCVYDRTEYISMSNATDVFLNPDGRTVDKWTKDYLANEYNFFTDELIEDGAVDLTLETLADSICHLLLSSYSVCTYHGSFYVYFDLQNLSREDYLNSRMQEMKYLSLTDVEFVDGLFSEDLVLPDNVKGGIGLITVRSVSRVVFMLGEKYNEGQADFGWPLD